MVHLRRIDGTVAVFGNQGALWKNAMTWWDHETGSIWSQPLGEAILGPLKGERIELLPSTLTTWGEWRELHPETLALDIPDQSSNFDLEDMSIVVELGADSTAFPVRHLRESVANTRVNGVPIAVLIDPATTSNWAVFSRQLDDVIVELARSGDQIVDLETGTVFDPVRGIALSGPLEGEVLDILPGFTSFDEDYLNIWPNGRIWQP